MPMPDLNLAVIGNCAISALVDSRAKITWSCLPRVDGDPTFCSLLAGNGEEPAAGFFEIALEDLVHSEQYYLPNTAVLVTRLHDAQGSILEIVDFAPRFKRLGRFFRPAMLMRRLKAHAGRPRIRVRLRPTDSYGAHRPETSWGSNHIRYMLAHLTLRLTTDVPVSFVLNEIPFLLESPVSLILGPDETFAGPIADTVREFQEETVDYWREWSRYLSIPFEWQDAVIRAAITLKLCSFEESGAIVAALTTSIPEAPGTARNWDYRYCWLRDAYFVVHALNRLGVTRTMEDYLRYITNVVASSIDGRLQPVYSVTFESRLVEAEISTLAGYRGMGPVRIGNQAHEHIQNDAYGSVVMAATQMFFDRRLETPGDERMFELLERLGEQAVAVFDKPDAGIWEFRGIARVHTFSSVMCWAACDRLSKIAARLGLGERARRWREHAEHIHRTIDEHAWNPQIDSYVVCFDGDDVDASLLLIEQLGFVKADDPRFAGTVAAIERTLKKGELIYRYAAPDDFGVPQTAFTICTFWYIDALAALGRKEEARGLFARMLTHRNHVGLLSEDIDVHTGELWGNFPQTYSLVGLISSAVRLSKSWEEGL
jgi:GH15 family glucan-1,4-alpha-glucosidase